MIENQNKLNVVGNNIANARTVGYKKDLDAMKVFEESFLRIKSKHKDKRIGTYQNMVHTDQVYTNFEQGLLEVTDRALDVVINDRNGSDTNRYYSFFEVEENGQRFLTKAGRFELDSEGYLNTTDGSFVLNNVGQPINLFGVQSVSITNDGEITDSETGQYIDTIQIRTIREDNMGFVEKFGHSKFKVMTVDELQSSFGNLNQLLVEFDVNRSLQSVLLNRETLENIANTGEIDIFEITFPGELGQGMIEQSNVDLSNEMTSLLIAQKGFNASSKALMVADSILEKDVNKLGS